ncbi:MAG: hypothetical protein ACLSHU_09250 [Oscillospiraceae bacterium]
MAQGTSRIGSYSISCGVMMDFARRLAALGATIRMEHERAECCHGGLYYGLGRTGEGAQEKAPPKAGPSARARPGQGGPSGGPKQGPGSLDAGRRKLRKLPAAFEEARGARAGETKNPPPDRTPRQDQKPPRKPEQRVRNPSGDHREMAEKAREARRRQAKAGQKKRSE